MAFDNYCKIFKDNPQIAIQLLSAHREDTSEYVRKSAGNALRDISKKFPESISDELNSWDLSAKEIKQVYKYSTSLSFLVSQAVLYLLQSFVIERRRLT